MVSDKPKIIKLDGKPFKLRPNLEDDWEAAEMLAEAEEDASPSAAVKLAKYILGDNPDAYQALKRASVNPDSGHVSTERLTAVLKAALAAHAPN